MRLNLSPQSIALLVSLAGVGMAYLTGEWLKRKVAETDEMLRRVAKGEPVEDVRARGTTRKSASRSRMPPKGAEYILFLITEDKLQDAVLGDLEERYHRALKRFGPFWAKVDCWGRVAKSLWPFMAGAVERVIAFILRRGTS